MKFEIKERWGSTPSIKCGTQEFHLNRTLREAVAFQKFLKERGADVNIKHRHCGLQMLEAFDITINGQRFDPRSDLEKMVNFLNSMGA